MFISFEGGEGTGKSTQASILRERLVKAGYQVLLVREPGSTKLGDYLREWLKRENRNAMPPIAELFLFAAARAALVKDVIEPTLRQSNTVVLTDRYADSSVAYQGYGRKIPQKDVAVVNRLATQGVIPDLTFLLDCPVAEGLTRVGAHVALPMDLPDLPDASRVDPEGTRRFEQAPLKFHERVRTGYRRMASREPERWCVIDASMEASEVTDEVWAVVQQRLNPEDASSKDVDANLPLWADERVMPTTT